MVEATVTAITTAMVTWKSPVASSTRNTMVSGAPMIAGRHRAHARQHEDVMLGFPARAKNRPRP